MKDIKQPFYIVEFHFIEENCKRTITFKMLLWKHLNLSKYIGNYQIFTSLAISMQYTFLIWKLKPVAMVTLIRNRNKWKNKTDFFS